MTSPFFRVQFFFVLSGLLMLDHCAQAETIKCKKYGYTIDLPAGWVQIPDNFLQASLNATQKPGSKVIYDAGFQLAPKDHWLEYPYVIVQPIPIDHQIIENQFPGVVRQLTGQDVQKTLDSNLTAEASKEIGRLNSTAPILDSAKRRFIWNMSADIKGIGVIRGIAVGNFGRETVTQVCFYCRAEEWDRFAKDRESLIDSFHFDSDKAYSNQVASDSSPTELSPAVVGAISGAIGGLVAVLYLSSRANKAKAVEEKSAIQNDSITP